MEKNMKLFKEHLKESMEAKKYSFRVKNADLKLESLLGKWKVSSFKKSGTTPVQQYPLDFPKLKNEQVSIYEVTLDYPTTQQELTEYIASGLSIARENFVVRRPGEPYEEYQEPKTKSTQPLLTDNDYKEAPDAKFEDYFGDKYNSGFVKELNDILKLQRKARGEEIPSPASDDIMKNPGKDLNGIPQHNQAPIQQAYDPRK
jgi:hypothetical protein